MDGTASIITGRSPYQEELCEQDKVNVPVIITMNLFREAGYKIIICSGRDEGRGRAPTERWLAKHEIHYDELFLRPSGDLRKDAIIKKEIYLNQIKPKYDIFVCLDDRDQIVKMLRDELGLTVFQVNWGNF